MLKPTRTAPSAVFAGMPDKEVAYGGWRRPRSLSQNMSLVGSTDDAQYVRLVLDDIGLKRIGKHVSRCEDADTLRADGFYAATGPLYRFHDLYRGHASKVSKSVTWRSFPFWLIRSHSGSLFLTRFSGGR